MTMKSLFLNLRRTQDQQQHAKRHAWTDTGLCHCGQLDVTSALVTVDMPVPEAFCAG